jgi:photosystem II stability/assembly factor-like uncharacterized protein
MNTSATMLTSRFILLIIILAVLSCDSLTGPDNVTPEKFTQSDYYTLPGSSVIIDLESVIDQSFLNGTLSIFENPKRGTLSNVTTTLLKYKPGREFREGEDRFVLSVVSDGKILAKGTMTIKMKRTKKEFPCALAPVEDKVKLKPGSPAVSTRILENDWFCDIDKSNVTISIESQPEFGHAMIDNESIVYTPAAEYKDRDELIYKVTESTGKIVSYGLLSFRAYQVNIQKIPNGMRPSLFFVDEQTGFLSTHLGAYKTTDGGYNWDLMEATWNWLPLPVGQLSNYEVTSIMFTSESTGFIVVYFEFGYGLEGASYTEVMKTEDRGVTWKRVLHDASDIQFINRTTGYANLPENVFLTKDAGETWTEVYVYPWIDRSQLINRFHVTEKNKFFAVFGETIITSEAGSEWRTVAHFSSNIFSIGFSPSAEVGYALVGHGPAPLNNNNDPNFQPISIFKTVDKGETWVEEIMDEELQGFPIGMSIPSNDVAYFLCHDRIIKYSNK